jgi:hypothetical protein
MNDIYEYKARKYKHKYLKLKREYLSKGGAFKKTLKTLQNLFKNDPKEMTEKEKNEEIDHRQPASDEQTSFKNKLILLKQNIKEDIKLSLYDKNEGLEDLEPKRVKLSTNKYKAESNVIIEFFNEGLEKDTESIILVNDIYEMFKGWYANSYSDKKPLPRKKLIEYFNQNEYNIISNNKGMFVKGLKSKEPGLDDSSVFDHR